MSTTSKPSRRSSWNWASGLKLEGESKVEGPLVGSLIGLKDVRATLAMMRTPDGQGIELDKFHTPDAIRFGPVDAPVNTLGFRRVMFAVDDIDALVARMRANGAELIGEMQYENAYPLAYIRGPEGIIVALAEQLGQGAPAGERTGVFKHRLAPVRPDLQSREAETKQAIVACKLARVLVCNENPIRA